MTDLGPLPLGFTPGFAGGPQDDLSSGPIITTLPATQKSLTKKYQALGPQLSGLPPSIINALYAFDTQRANRGAQPLGRQQTFDVLSSAITGQATTQPKRRSTSLFSIPGNAVHDLANILAAVPRLPHALAEEITQLPQAPAKVLQALGAGSLPGVVAGLTEVPGLRMVPGAYTAHNLATGQPGEILRHPLMTLLDLYPAAEKTGLTAELGEQAAAVGGKLADTNIGQDALMTIRGNKGVQYLQQTFGNQARDLSQEAFHRNAQLHRDVAASPQVAFSERWKGLSDEDKILATHAYQLGEVDSLSDHLQAFAEDMDIEANRLGQAGAEAGTIYHTPYGRGNGDTNMEYLDPVTFNKHAKRHYLTQVAQREGELRSTILDPASTGATLESLSDVGKKAVLSDSTHFPNKTAQYKYLYGVTYALDSLGYDAYPLRQLIRQASEKVPARLRVSTDTLASAFNDFSSSATPHPPAPTPAEIRAQFSQQARRDPKVAVFLDNLDNGNYRAAARAAKTIDSRTFSRPDDWTPILESTKRLRDQTTYLSKPPIFTEKDVARIAKKEESFVARNAPARFKATIINRAEQNVLAGFSDDPDFPAITKAISERNYSQYPGLKEEMAASIDGIERTWQDIRDEGHNIGFISHISPESINATLHPTVLPRTNLIESWAKKRTLDVTSYVPDATVSIPHQAMETLRKTASESFVNDYIIPSYARYAESPLGDKPPLIDDFLPTARRRYPTNPEMVRQEAERLMRREYAEFDPNSFLPKSSKLTNLGKDKMWVQKNVLRNLERMRDPISNGFTAIMDPVLNAFRVSVLGFSPRFQVNNIVGGGMLAVAEDPGILLHLSKAAKMLKSGEIPDEILKVADQIGIGTGLGQIPRESLEWRQLQAKTLFQHASGTQLRSLFDAAQKGRELASGIVDKSFAANAFIDDMYRSAAYMRGFDKALTKGLSTAEAEAAGITLSRKILQKWDRMTPVERTVLRYVAPFYGWMSHITPYVLRYPFDHPLRASIMSSFTRNEINDMGSGLPERFLNAFFLGHPDKNGNVKAIQTGGLNPFSGVANYFTWAGFSGNVNPVVSSILEALGVDTQNGSPQLYPELVYDPESGRVVTRGKSFLPELLSNVIPQSQLLTGLAGASNEFKSMMRNDPAAAARSLLSAGGIPILYRDFNVPQEQFKSELARQTAQNTAKSNALKSGHLGSLNDYPSLRGYVAQLQALQQSGKLGAYHPQVDQPGILESLGGAVTP